MRILLVLFFVISLSAGCSKDIILDVETVSDGKIDGLGERDLAEISKIREALAGEKEDLNIRKVIQENPNYSIREYLSLDPDALDPKAHDYKVGGADVLNISVYEEPDLSRETIPVSARGYISFPFIGRIKVTGLTTSEIEELISWELVNGGYILNAHVSVTVTEYNSKKYTIVGGGGTALKARERVFDVLAGVGIDFEVAQKEGLIIRTLNPGTDQETRIVIHLDLSEFIKGGIQLSNIVIHDKDMIYIPKPQYYYVITSSGGSKIAYNQKEITLLEAIISSVGFAEDAATNRVRVIRVEDGVEKIYTVNVDNIVKTGNITKDFIVKPGDFIVVPESYF